MPALAPTAVEATRVTAAASRFDAIDLLRALAILCTLMNHVNMRLYLAGIPYTLGLPRQLVSTLFWKGQQGVQIFFALSGFLITSMALRRWRSLGAIPLRAFYTLRAARILPLLLALLALLSLLHTLHLHDYLVQEQTGGLSRALLAALTFHVGWLEATRGYLPASWDVLWSLGVEECFYLGFPLLCLLLVRTRRIAILLALFVLLGPFARTLWAGSNEVWSEYSYLGGMDAIALGVLTALVLHRKPLSRRLQRIALGAGLALMALCLGASMQLSRLYLNQTGLSMSLVALATCLMLAAASQSGWRAPRPLLPLLLLGRCSYEIYLTHMFVVFALFHGFQALGSPAQLVAPLFVATLLLAALLGWLVERLFSEPANRILRRLWLSSNAD